MWRFFAWVGEQCSCFFSQVNYERSVARELEFKVRDVCTQALARVLAHVCARMRALTLA